MTTQSQNSQNHDSNGNPFFRPFFSTYDESIPFDQIKTEHFLPALTYGIELARKNIEAIKTQTAEPNFTNTILALECASEAVEIVQTVYFNLFSAEASEELQALAKDISPLAAAFVSEITLDPILFQKIKSIYDRRNELNLNSEQLRLVDKIYKDFGRNGALLSASEKEMVREIDQQIAVLGPQFSENVLKATNAFELWIDNREDLAGLPEGTIEAAAMAAKEKKQEGKWLFNLHAPSLIPFLQYSEKRELRQKLWTAYNSRSFGDAFDNQNVILKLVELRHRRAQTLGYASHAAFVLEERMAQSPTQVTHFLEKLLTPSKKAAEKEIAELVAFQKQTEKGTSLENIQMMPWDFSYYSEKLKESKYNFNDEELRPYFQLEKVVDGVFEHARKLYDLEFHEIHDIAKYHPDVRTFEVRDQNTKEYVGLFYTDFFPRETKKGGAWMTVYRDQGYFRDQVRRPHISIVCNFTKPTPSKPSLLTYDEVQTLFHEFGHALHGLLSNVTYRSLSGTSVYWDFVELPSQIMENWVKEKESLDLFARHYQTKELIPLELVQKIKNSSKFLAGYHSLRQIQFGLLDMGWHQTDPAQIKDVESFENKLTEKTRLLPKPEGTNTSCAFSHIFPGGYSAGYYSYKWAEVLDADAFEYFKEKGLFDKTVSTLFKKHILSRGGTEHPMELYKKFRGREPDPNALLRREGLLT